MIQWRRRGCAIDAIAKNVDKILQLMWKMEIRMTQMDDRLAQLEADLTAENLVIDKAIVLIGGIQQSIKDAVAAATAAGATPAQLQSLVDLDTSLTGKSQALAAAIAAEGAAP